MNIKAETEENQGGKCSEEVNFLSEYRHERGGGR